MICGKQKLSIKRYDDHMTFYHQISLKNPDVEEYDIARNMWLYQRETSTPEELQIISCDYDSETGKRYSEVESEEESNTEDTLDRKLKPSSSETQSSSDNTYEGKGELKKLLKILQPLCH